MNDCGRERRFGAGQNRCRIPGVAHYGWAGKDQQLRGIIRITT